MTYRDVVLGATLTQGFGMTDYAKVGAYGGGPHTGIDLAAPKGTQVNWPVPVKSVYRGWEPNGYGNFVVGTYGDVEILFGHFDRFGSGGVAGYIGSTGNSTGNHTHFEVRRNGRAIDPIAWLASIGVESGQGANEMLENAKAEDWMIDDKVRWLAHNIGRPIDAGSYADVRKNHYRGGIDHLANEFFDNDASEYRRNVAKIYEEAGGVLTDKDFEAKRKARVPFVQLLRELNRSNRK